MNEIEELQNHVIQLFDEKLIEEYGTGISYGEIAYIESLTKEELEELQNELESGL